MRCVIANLPAIKRFKTEDYEGIDEKFIESLNIVTEAFFNALNGNLNHQNIAGEIYERIDIFRNTPVTPDRPIRLQWSKALPPVSVVCGGIWKRGADSKSTVGVSPFLEWDYDSASKVITIKAINGLTLPSSTDYQITIHCTCK